jgi:hypothetical protein
MIPCSEGFRPRLVVALFPYVNIGLGVVSQMNDEGLFDLTKQNKILSSVVQQQIFESECIQSFRAI